MLPHLRREMVNQDLYNLRVCVSSTCALDYLAIRIPVPAQPTQATIMREPCSWIKSGDAADTLAEAFVKEEVRFFVDSLIWHHF